MPDLGKIKIVGDIKSSYIMKGVFSFINEKQKLNMMTYNKKLQGIFGVEIKDYQKISQKIKIAEKNGKGKEYDLDTKQLIFLGEYLNGKRNGKGREYDIDTNQLIFSGKYLNGKRNGKGKEYYKNRELRLEGE